MTPMRLDLLLKRENFPQVFEKSFTKYLSDVFGVVAFVNWTDKSKSKGSLFANRKLNVIYSKNIDRIKLRSIVSEYAYHPNLLRHFLQKTYINLAMCSYFEWFFVNAKVEVELQVNSCVVDLSSLCIIPGNHSIRIIDLNASRCRVILKEGFDAKFIKNEINLREKYRFLPIPKLLNFDSKGFWYEEEQVSALPLNRVSSQDLKDKVLLSSQFFLLRLYEETLVKVNVGNYTELLYDSCDSLIKKLPNIYSKVNKNRVRNILTLLRASLGELKAQDIKLVQSHGDFQPANILIDNIDQKLYLIDWEYSCMRSVYYDALVFATQSRSPQGLSKRIWMISNEINTSWNWCIKDTNTKLTKTELIIFLIEDLIVRLSELQIPHMINKDEGLDNWIQEIEQMDWFIHA